MGASQDLYLRMWREKSFFALEATPDWLTEQASTANALRNITQYEVKQFLDSHLASNPSEPISLQDFEAKLVNHMKHIYREDKGDAVEFPAGARRYAHALGEYLESELNAAKKESGMHFG